MQPIELLKNLISLQIICIYKISDIWRKENINRLQEPLDQTKFFIHSLEKLKNYMARKLESKKYQRMQQQQMQQQHFQQQQTNMSRTTTETSSFSQQQSLHESNLSMQVKSGGFISGGQEQQVEGYTSSLKPTSEGELIRTQGDLQYSQTNMQQSGMEQVQLRKTSGTKDIKDTVRQSGVFVGIAGDHNALVSEMFDNEKHSVSDMVKHFSKIKPGDIPQNIMPQHYQMQHAPPSLSELQDQAKDRQFSYQKKDQVDSSSTMTYKEQKEAEEKAKKEAEIKAKKEAEALALKEKLEKEAAEKAAAGGEEEKKEEGEEEEPEPYEEEQEEGEGEDGEPKEETPVEEAPKPKIRRRFKHLPFSEKDFAMRDPIEEYKIIKEVEDEVLNFIKWAVA